MIKIKKGMFGHAIKSQIDYPARGDFQALRDAEKTLSDQEYSIGSMCGQDPIGFARNVNYSSIAKWQNIPTTEYHKLDGVILSKSFRDQTVTIVYFE